MNKSVILLLLTMITACSNESKDVENSSLARQHDNMELDQGDRQSALDGAQLFNKNCHICHGDGANFPGTERLAVRSGREHAVLENRENLSPAYVKWVVRNGLAMMPTFRPTELSDAEVAAIASYLAGQSSEEQ
ncbi:hypothetical protein R50073_10310 [Maricurvus nonylphenolicus]|uniref:c-type cytochrome n=1 Tax=Maricurvus nonylphenolicus TaxID=1008307 RepID=UPI0036F40E0A